MKASLVLSGLFVLIPVLPAAVAYGQRGIAERMLYWMAYVCEGETKSVDPSYSYTIAPECVGKSSSGRCSLDEFLVHIWAPKGDDNARFPDTVRPTGLKTPIGLMGCPPRNFNRFEGLLGNSKFNTKAPIDGNVNTARLYPGATDYYDALSKMGGPMEAFSQAVTTKKSADPDWPVGSRVRIWKFAQDCTEYVFALRRKDMDSFRATFLRDYLNKPRGTLQGFDVSKKQIDTAKTISGGNPEIIQAIDFDATIANYKSTVPDIENLLREANRAYMNVEKPAGEYINRNHLRATEAARAAMVGCNCKHLIPRELKRKSKREAEFYILRARVEEVWTTNPAAVHWGGPKAARSRQMRDQRLASIGVNVKA
ncbi:hypothetical protein G7046_g6339 [Stylonectria norvegica]|nr:hypothetical protein G7046_g6339 [Stylonectria norvegica]